MLGKDLLIYLAIKYKGDFKSIVKAIENKEPVDECVAEKAISKLNCKVVTVLDDDYPEELRRVYMPPLVLFYKGGIQLLKTSSVKLFIDGGSKMSEYGKNMAKTLTTGIAKKGRVVVTGSSAAINKVILKSCIEAGSNPICVLNTNLDQAEKTLGVALAKKIAKSGLLITEYPVAPPAKLAAETVPASKRVLAGLGDKQLVIESHIDDASNIGVLYALRQGKDVMAVPDRADAQSSCNRLIQDGAFLVETVEDVEYLTEKKN